MPALLSILPSEKNPRCCRPSPADQGNPSGAAAALTIQALADWRIGSSFRRFSMGTLAACVITASLGMGALAQQFDLEHGLYVNIEAPCDDFPAVAALSFDGQHFGYKQVQCTPNYSMRAGDAYDVSCIEGNDASTKEARKWVFKQLSRSSFSIDGTQYRICRTRR